MTHERERRKDRHRRRTPTDPFDIVREALAQTRDLPDGQGAFSAEAALAEIKERLRESEEYAKEGWFWVDKALAASGWKTVFDIPAWEEKP